MQSKNIVLATITALGTGLIVGAAVAQGLTGGKMFQKLDTDSSGTVSQAEARAGQGRMFARLDTDGDGAISREEFQATADRRFAIFDLDSDGEVSLGEVAQVKAKWKSKSAN